MTLPLIVWKSLRQHALSTAVTALSIALAAGLLMAVWTVKEQSRATFSSATGDFDGVLGARGAKLQLVLNAVFHLEASPGNLAWADYEAIQKDGRVALADPLAVGDNYRGYRLAGTTPEFFTRAGDQSGKKFSIAAGRFFDPTLREAVVGSFAAQRLGLRPGDKFHPFHGLTFDETKQHAETYVVVGVLKPSNTPADRVIWIPLEGIQKMTGHAAETESDISAVLVKLKSPAFGQQLDLQYNRQGNRLTFAWPIGRVLAEMFDKIGWFDQVLALVAYLVALVAVGSVLASLYNSMNERRREIAILRTLGAHRTTVFGAIVLESAAITTLGVLTGFLIHAVIVFVVAGVLRAQTGVVLDPFAFSSVMLGAPAALIALGALAGMVPAVKAYRVPVAENLTPMS